ncbi:isochorismatase family protein [candidate division KSB1 bacterium]|nr:isochorismatase family protein [candidate division KSB1 bacterium]
MQTQKALLVVDIQNDFCPGGALGVREGDQIIPVVNEYVQLFLSKNLPVFVSRDWHPKKTKHFQEFGGPWPIHCVRNTKGGKFHPDFRVPGNAIILSKGSDPQLDGYSVFEALDSNNNPFLEVLKKMSVNELYISGIATDYCVRFTALDALKNGFKLNILVDAIKGVDKDDSERVLDEITSNNAKVKDYDCVKKELTYN